MKHLNEITALSRAALAGDREASTEAVERLLEALMAENDDIPAIDAILTAWDKARHERYPDPMRGMKPIPMERDPEIYGYKQMPPPFVLTIRIACPTCAKRFWLYGSYFRHWEGEHQVRHSHQRI